MIERDKRTVLDMGLVGPPITDQFSETTISAHQDMPTRIEVITIDRVTGHFDMVWAFPGSRGLWEWQGRCVPAQKQF